MSDIVTVKQGEKAAKKKGRKPSTKLMMLLALIVTLLALGAAGYFWNEARSAKSETPEAVAERNQEESVRVIAALDNILLTESEGAPTVARVEDPDVLRQANEDFYKNAAEGDYLVLYPQRAILYRESTDLIVNVAPIINTDQLRSNTQGTTPAEGSDSTEATSGEGNQ